MVRMGGEQYCAIPPARFRLFGPSGDSPSPPCPSPFAVPGEVQSYAIFAARGELPSQPDAGPGNAKRDLVFGTQRSAGNLSNASDRYCDQTVGVAAHFVAHVSAVCASLFDKCPSTVFALLPPNAAAQYAASLGRLRAAVRGAIPPRCMVGCEQAARAGSAEHCPDCVAVGCSFPRARVIQREIHSAGSRAGCQSDPAFAPQERRIFALVFAPPRDAVGAFKDLMAVGQGCPPKREREQRKTSGRLGSGAREPSGGA